MLDNVYEFVKSEYLGIVAHQNLALTRGTFVRV